MPKIKNTLYIGLDAHKESITIALAEAGKRGEVRLYGSITNSQHAIERFLTKMRKAHPNTLLSFVYEAGPTGFVLYRHLTRKGYECIVTAPSLIPTKSGDKLKTDKRDAKKLARLHRAGELTAIHVPEAKDEAIRDLCRARTDAVRDQRSARQQLGAFLLRNGYNYKGKTKWTEAHMRYLRELTLPHPAQKVILEEYLMAISAAGERITRIEMQMEKLYRDWSFKPVVDALMAFRGFQLVGAMIVVSELGHVGRFTHPRQLMAYLGLVPSENSTGTRRRQGAITKCGNSHARWILIEAAQHYRLEPKVSAPLSKRQQGQSSEVKNLSWKTQNRLHERYWLLAARGLHRNIVIVSVARELCGFIWALYQQVAKEGAPCQAQSTP